MTGILSASLALVIVLIVALDCPFRGQLSISSDIYQRIFESVVPAMNIDLAMVRSVEPDYREMTDSVLIDTIYSRYFSDLPRKSFDRMLLSEPP